MHRSGTSCLAGAMERCGVYLGEVGRSDRYNAKGNHEYDPARLLDDQILQANGGTWSDPPPQIAVDDAQRAAMRALVGELSRRPPCGLKDPRALLVLDAWIEAAGEPALVGTYRHPAAVAASLAHRNQMPAEQAHALWLRYNAALVARHRARPFPIVAFDLSDPERYCATVVRVAERLGLRPDEERLRDFVSAELDHGKQLDTELPESCRTTWEYLESVREPWATPAASGTRAASDARASADARPAPATAGATLHLVSGPTCAGKSVFIARHVDQGEAVLLPDKGARAAIELGGRFLVHYNLLRPFDKIVLEGDESFSGRLRRRMRRVRGRLRGPFSIDRRLEEILATPAVKEASVLVVPRAELLERIRRRRAQEPLRSQDEGYRSARWDAIVRQVDLLALYRDWLAFLRQHGVRYRLVDARDEAYRTLADEQQLAALLAEGESRSTR